MLDVVQRERLTFDRDQLGAPRAVREQARRDVDVANAGDGIVVEDDPDGKRVVEVDPVGELFRPIYNG